MGAPVRPGGCRICFLPREPYNLVTPLLAAHLYNFLLLCWRSQCIPQDLKNAVTVTLYKNKGSRQDCNNYKGISLLSVVGKVLARVILPRLQVLAHLILPESQCGFRPHRSTTDMIVTLRQLQEKCLEQRKPLIVVFIDLTKAFDMLCRGGLFAILQRLGCPDILLSIISGFHNRMQASARYSGSSSKAFPVTRGVKQHRVLAPTLFAIYFSELLLRAFPSTSGVLLHSRSSGKLFNLSRFRTRSKTRRMFIRELLYADGAAFVAHSIADAQVLRNSFTAACIDL